MPVGRTEFTKKLLPISSDWILTDLSREAEMPRNARAAATVRLDEVRVLLRIALLSLVLMLVAGFLGFAGVAFAAAGFAKILFAVFLIVFLVGLIAHLGRGDQAV